MLKIYCSSCMHVTVLRHGNWSSVPWADVKVGDFVKVTSSQFFPADLVLLSSRSEVPAYLIDILLWSVFCCLSNFFSSFGFYLTKSELNL